MLIFTFNVCSDTLDLLLLQSSSSNEGNNWVTISSSVTILAKLIAVTAKYLLLGSPGRAAVISNESSVQAVGILLPTDNSRGYQGSADGQKSSSQSSSSLQSRKAVIRRTGALWDGADPTLLLPVPWSHRPSPFPPGVRIVEFFLIITNKKMKNISVLC